MGGARGMATSVPPAAIPAKATVAKTAPISQEVAKVMENHTASPSPSRDSSFTSADQTPLLASERARERQEEEDDVKQKLRGGAGEGLPRKAIGRHVEPFFLLKLGAVTCSCYDTRDIVDDDHLIDY